MVKNKSGSPSPPKFQRNFSGFKRAGYRKLNIGLDLDGVIIDQTKNKIRAAKSLGFQVKERETPSEILKNILPEKDYRELQRKVYGKITLKTPFTSFALKSIAKLSKNHNLFIISRRKTPGTPLAWLKKQGVLKYIPKKKIFFVKKDEDKNGVVKKLKIDVFLDDKISVLEHLSSAPYPIFFNFHKIKVNRKFLEVKSWKEFSKLLEKIEKGLKPFSTGKVLKKLV